MMESQTLDLKLTGQDEDRITGLFLRTTDKEQDDLNLLIILNALRGFNTIEHDEYGIPLEMLTESNLWEWIALYSGVGTMNETDIRNLSGLNVEKTIKKITKPAYVSGKDEGLAANALFEMKRQKLGYNGEKSWSVEERMNDLDTNVKLQFLRSLYIPKIVNRSFPPRGEYTRLFKPGIKREDTIVMPYGEREAAIRQLLQHLKAKEPKPYVINPNGTFREGWIVPVEGKKGRKDYFVQRNTINIAGVTYGDTDIYHCNCRSGWPKLISTTPRSMQAC